jgi:hypothetical protein
VPLAAIASTWFGFAVARAIVRPPDVSRVAELFVAATRARCLPEPAKQLGYLAPRARTP